MANWYLSSVGYAAVPAFAVSTAYLSTANGGRGSYVRQLATPTVGNERVFRCTTSGTSAASEPSWNLTKNSTTTSGSATFTECTGQEADQGAGGVVWKAPHARISAAVASGWLATGDTLYVGDDHAETQSTSLDVTQASLGAVSVICVKRLCSIPPVAADLSTGGSITVTGTGGLMYRIGFGSYTYGLRMSGGSGGSLQLQLNRFVNCAFDNQTTNYGGYTIASSILEDCILTLSHNTNVQQVSFGGTVLFKNVSFSDTSNFSLGATALISMYAMGTTLVEGCDWTNAKCAVLLQNHPAVTSVPIFKDCKFASTVTAFSDSPSSGYYSNLTESNFIRCAIDNKPYATNQIAGGASVETDVIVVRTGGATDGVYPYSSKVVSAASLTTGHPFRCLPLAVWNTVTQTNINVTVEGIASPVAFSALPKNDEVWFDCEYLGYSGAPLGKYANGGKTNPIATGVAHTASTAAWDSKATARANSTVYALGAPIKLASNPGRLFFCTTAGTSTTTEPGGYASAVDGGSVTDGTATFKAGWRFKQTVLLGSPQVQTVGPITVTPKMGKASATLYIDPKITLS